MEKETNCSAATVTVRGIVSSGIGQSELFTELRWVKKQFREKLGISPYPGTLNITVSHAYKSQLEAIRQMKGIEIMPKDAGYCSGKGFPALINGKVRGAVIFPLVPHYPDDKLELISSEYLKQSLSLKDGDEVEVIVYI